ncbi:hypothetical protein [Paenibacillus sp. LHD-38]|uniref:hypothetical protein n=1 Tax=Paenibacillus sp. LHD-38 TaxID=3072143 RepID=UPI00280E6698|nr:hypothetical protein [Paenibacillus sp. LHD-38]MDQ8736181.1 hypothetical protein [Paenibacillus sp. LHD-38]
MRDLIDEIKMYGLLHKDVISKLIHKKYYYQSSETYANTLFNLRDVKQANKIYWEEILLRAHFASVTSIMRNEKWLSGIIMSIETNNFIVFSASLRGFLESVTDSCYSLSSPFDFTNNYKNIKQAVDGNLSKYLISQELEEKLIHFQFAAKSDKSGIKHNQPLSATDYIRMFDQHSDINTKKLYSKLCEVVHPAHDSISYFKTNVRETENFEYSITKNTQDDLHIEIIISEYRDVISNLLKLSLSTPFIYLKILNLFEIDLVQSEYIDSCIFNNLINEDVWIEVLGMVRKSYEL